MSDTNHMFSIMALLAHLLMSIWTKRANRYSSVICVISFKYLHHSPMCGRLAESADSEDNWNYMNLYT